MDLALYSSTSGVFVAVPNCLRPSMEAEHQHGPLAFHRRLRLDEHHAKRVSPHLADRIDADSYAVITPDELRRLLEAELTTGGAPGADDPGTSARASGPPAGRNP